MKLFGLLAALLMAGQSDLSVISSGPDVVYARYKVRDVAAFKKTWVNLPHRSLVFWNGLMIQPGLDFTSAGMSIQITDPLAVGDTITVVTLP